MRLKGRRQSGNVLDLRDPKMKQREQSTRGSLSVQRKIQENIAQDARRVIPKSMTGFSAQDMERSVRTQRTIRALKKIGMRSR